MDNIHQLRVAKRMTPLEEIRLDVISLLEKTLVEAKAGEIDEVVILTKCSEAAAHDDEWVERASATMHFRAWIGAIELLKASWVSHYRSFRDPE
jgi:hypothetical protein